MAWRVEWTGGDARGVAPVGWGRFDSREAARACALEAMRGDPRIDLRVVLTRCIGGEDVDVEAVTPGVATLTTWRGDAMLPLASRHSPAMRMIARQEAACVAVGDMRAVLDQLVERDELSRGDAARLVAALAAAMMRSASANAA